MNIEIFDKIDDYFQKKDKKEFYYTLIGIVGGIGFLIFYFVMPKAEEFLNSNKKEFQNLTNRLNQDRMTLSNLRIRNVRIRKELKQIKEHLSKVNKDKVFYSELVNLLDFIQFNKYNWALFVKNSIIDAKAQGLEVLLVKNIKVLNKNDEKKAKNSKNIKNKNHIVKKMGFSLTLRGKYKNFIYYMYKYENIKPLIRVSNFKITAPNEYYIEFSLYGYEQ